MFIGCLLCVGSWDAFLENRGMLGTFLEKEKEIGDFLKKVPKPQKLFGKKDGLAAIVFS